MRRIYGARESLILSLFRLLTPWYYPGKAIHAFSFVVAAVYHSEFMSKSLQEPAAVLSKQGGLGWTLGKISSLKKLTSPGKWAV